MGSNVRKIKRDAAKQMYKKFCKNWAEAVSRQNMLHPSGNRHSISVRKKAMYAERGDPILGRRPTFNEWWDAVKTTEQAAAATPEEVQEHIDLTWDDE